MALAVCLGQFSVFLSCVRLTLHCMVVQVFCEWPSICIRWFLPEESRVTHFWQEFPGRNFAPFSVHHISKQDASLSYSWRFESLSFS